MVLNIDKNYQMGKNRAADFKKNVIKAGKKLPKHLNETKPELKAKKIKIKTSIESIDPIKSLANPSLSSTKKHYYLNKLNYLANEDSSSIDSENVQVVCRFIIDNDSRVREQAVNYLTKYINHINQNDIEPPLPLLTIILKMINCGLTHINANIRKNASNILDNIIGKFASNSHFDSQLIQMFLTLIDTRTAYQLLDNNYYRILSKYLMAIKKRFTKLEEEGEIIQKTNGPKLLTWLETNDNYLDLNQFNTLDNMFSTIGEFNLTFQNCSEISETKYNQFMETIHDMVIKDIKTLIGKQPTRVLFLHEALTAISALKIAKTMNYKRELSDYWENKPPVITISDTPITKEIENRTNELSRLIINLNNN